MRIGTLSLALSLSVAAFQPVAALAEPVRVVASFSILADMVSEIGGDNVQVDALVGPNGDAHVFQPSPADTRRLADADLVVANGLGFEGWMPRLVEASGFKGTVVTATDGIEALPTDEGHEHGHEHEGHDHGEDAHAHEGHDHDHDTHEHAEAEDAHDHDHDHDAHEHAEDDHDHDHGHAGHNHGPLDPHAWQDLENGVIYARNIARGLSDADPENATTYSQRADAYIARITQLDADVKSALAAIPEERRKVVTSHDAFGYYSHAYGVEFLAPEGVSTEAEASAADVAAIIRQIREDGISAVFVESISDSRLIDQIRAETGAAVGGTLYSDALSDDSGPAPTYLDMIRYNTQQIVDALKLG